MNTKTTLAATVLALAAAFTLTGCGNGTPVPSETPTVADTPTPSTPTPPADENVDYTVAEDVIELSPEGTATLPDGSEVSCGEGSTTVAVYADGTYICDTPIEGLD